MPPRALSDFYGRWTFPVNPEAEDVVNDFLHDTGTLANQSSVFYVHLGYTATTVDITLREALSDFVQALTGCQGDNEKDANFGGLLAFTGPKEELTLAASNSLLQNYTDGVCECLNVSHPTLNCTEAAANKSNIVACYRHVQHPLISMNDLMRNETIGYSPGRPTSGGESGLNLWAGIPNFGTLGTFPMPYPPPGKDGLRKPSPETVEILGNLGCDNTNSSGSGGTQWGPRNSMGQIWTCPNVTTVDVDLRNYMPKSKVDSLSRFIGSNIPFKLTAYYFSKGNTPKSCICSDQRFAWCDCAGSALIGVTSDIELDLIDKLEPFVGQNCGSSRSV